MPLKKQGKPPYLTAEDVKEGDIVEIAEEPFVVPAEQTKWGRERGRIVIQLPDKNTRTWTLNTTTWDRLIDAYGDNGKLWIGKRIRVRREMRNVSGVDREVLFGYPYAEPQQTLDADKPLDMSEENRRLFKAIMDMPPEQRRQLLEGAKQ